MMGILYGRTRWRVALLAAAASAVLGSPNLHVYASARHPAQHEMTNRTLVPWVIAPLPLGTVQPLGWLRGELQAMADGLAGHQLDMYPYVRDSRWLYPPGSGRGTDYTGLNEGLPYWFNGLVPLAYALGDARLRAQADEVAQRVLALRANDGWIGPEVGPARNFWGRVPFLLGLMQLADANPETPGEVVAALRKFVSLAHGMLKDGGAGFSRCPGMGRNDCAWGQARAHSFIVVIQWLLEWHPSKDDKMLWETMDLLYRLNQYKWEDWYHEGVYQAVVTDPTPDNPFFPYLHGVNVGQGLKASAVIRRFTHNDSLLQSTWNAVNWTFKYHGAPSGTILADEIQRDLASYSGSELCTAVETAFSLAYLYHSLGSAVFADKAELATFNALPVMLTDDMWAHQYMDQPNGPWALNLIHQPSVYTTSHGGATVFGLEPVYPCCTVNHVQGYPKFLMNSWGRSRGGLVHALLSPSVVTTTVNGGHVSIECHTDYPFNDILTYTIRAARPFDLWLRVPVWAISPRSTVSVSLSAESHGTNPASTSTVTTFVRPDTETGLHRVRLPAGSATVVYTIDQPVRVESRSGQAVSVYVGNVLYALDVRAARRTVLPHRFWDPAGAGTTEFNASWPRVRDHYYNATAPWNVAIDPATVVVHRDASAAANSSSDNGSSVNGEGYLSRAFGERGNGNWLSVVGCEIDWPLVKGVTPDTPPRKPKCVGKAREFRMVPYGGAKAHMSELPTVKLGRRPGKGNGRLDGDGDDDSQKPIGDL